MVPKLTTEQRRKALDKGMQIRLERAEYKQKLKDGSMTVEQFFKLADSGYQAAYGMRVYSLLTSLPGYGEVRSRQLMNELRIAQGRKVKGLGTTQRARLLSILTGDDNAQESTAQGEEGLVVCLHRPDVPAARRDSLRVVLHHRSDRDAVHRRCVLAALSGNRDTCDALRAYRACNR